MYGITVLIHGTHNASNFKKVQKLPMLAIVVVYLN